MKFIKSKTFIAIISVLSTLILIIMVLFILGGGDDQYVSEDTLSEPCNVLSIQIRGEIQSYFSPESYDENGVLQVDGTSSEDIFASLKDLENYPNIKAILVTVDSNGGEVATGNEISEYLKHSGIPVIALIRSAANSAAYYAISGSDHIFASESSDIGAIGVTQSGLSNVKKNEKEGLTFIEINTGRFKDMLNPDKPITPEELKYVKAQIQIMYEKFIKDVASNRNLPIEKVRALADGSSVLGEEAKKLGLIDEIGNYYDATAYIAKLIGDKVYSCK